MKSISRFEKLANSENLDNIKKALDEWDNKSKNNKNKLKVKYTYRKLRRINFEMALSNLYAFESVVNIIDFEIENFLNNKGNTFDSEVKLGEDILMIKRKAPIKHKLFIDEWRTLDDIKFSTQQIKDLKLTSIEVLRLRCANYRGFINKIRFQINNLGYLIFELE